MTLGLLTSPLPHGLLHSPPPSHPAETGQPTEHFEAPYSSEASTLTPTPAHRTPRCCRSWRKRAGRRGGGRLLVERIRKAVGEVDSFKSECAELGRQADPLSTMLRSAIRRLSVIPNPYKRPARRIAAEASKSLDCALSLVRRCHRSNILRCVVSITTGFADFRKALAHLEASLGDLDWLLSVYSSDDPSDGSGTGGGVLSLPPIASTDPILSWVWSCIAAIQMFGRPSDRAEAATSLTNLALDSVRNKKIIIEEGRVPPLLALLRDGAAYMDA